MIHRPFFVLSAVATIALCGTAKEPKEIKTEKNKAVIVANFISTPGDCGTNPGPVPLMRSSIIELALHGIHTSRRTKASVTHVSGTFCHLSLGSLIHSLEWI
jgi:hypothetical protein